MEQILIDYNIKNFMHQKEYNSFVPKKHAPSASLVADLVYLTQILKQHKIPYHVDAEYGITLLKHNNTNQHAKVKL